MVVLLVFLSNVQLVISLVLLVSILLCVFILFPTVASCSVRCLVVWLLVCVGVVAWFFVCG